MIHTPVLLKEVVEALDPKEGDLVIDGTAGAGGHAREILKRIGGNGKMFLIDWDPQMASELEKEMRNFSLATRDLSKGDSIKVINASYADISDLIGKSELPKADGLLLDLGFSSDQLIRGRGFSFQKVSENEPLFMTYSDQQAPLKDLLKKMTEKEIFEIIRDYGEERFSKQIAKAIYENRLRISTSGDLSRIVSGAVPESHGQGSHRHGGARIHPATRTFQAFRIYVNDEFGNLRKILADLPRIMKKGGRVAVISFHSLEDRIVKEEFRRLEKEGVGERINKKIIEAGLEEVARNPRARSAKLRALRIL